MRKLYLGMIISAISLIVAAASVNAQTPDAPKNEVEITGIYAIPSGEANFATVNPLGTTVSFANDFGLKNRLGFGLRYTYRSENGKHKIMLSYDRTNTSNTRTLSRTFIFQDQTYTANLSVKAETSLTPFFATYAYRWGNKKVRIGPMGQIGFVKSSVTLTPTSSTTIAARSGSITTFAATIGYDLDYNPTDKVNIFNNVGGIAYSNERFLRGEFGLRYYLSRRFGVTGGYQFGRYKLVNNQNFILAREHGPVFGGVLRF